MKHLLASGIVFLAMVLNGSTAAQDQTLVVPAPDGITIHLTQSGIFVDANGTVFAKTRGPSSRGDIVWRMDGDQAVIVLEPGPEKAYGNGYLTVIGNACVLVTATKSNTIAAYVIPGCVAP